jgi:hypothetical protein
VDKASITRYIADMFDGVDVVVASREIGPLKSPGAIPSLATTPIGTSSRSTGCRFPRSRPKTDERRHR